MNKKTKNTLVAAVAATMGAGIVAPVVQAAAVDYYALALEAVVKAETSKDIKDIETAKEAIAKVTDAKKQAELSTRLDKVAGPVLNAQLKNAFDLVQKAKETKKLEDLKPARLAVDEMSYLLQDYKNTWSTELDPITQPFLVAVVDPLLAMMDSEAKINQTSLNEVRAIINGLPQTKALKQYILDYAGTQDLMQEKYGQKGLAAANKAKASGLQADIDAAKAIYADLMKINYSDALKADYEKYIGTILKSLDPAVKNFEIVSAEARSNTEITVVLKSAPLANLTAADFAISPSLTITNVTTNNNVVSIKTSPQTAGATYTVSTTTGIGSASFTGLAAVDTTGAISGIEVLNLRQIKVAFNREIKWGSAKEESSYYLEMVDDLTGDITTRRLDTILTGVTNNKWEMTAGDQEIISDETPVKYVILESSDGTLINNAKADGGLGIEYNKSITLEARNLVQKVGGYINTSQGAFTVVDGTAPKIVNVTANAEVGRMLKDNIIPAYLGYTLAADKAYVEVKFSEPVIDNGDVNAKLDLLKYKNLNSDFKVYVDGILVKTAGTAGTPGVTYSNAEIANPDAATVDGLAVEQDSIAEAQKTLLLDVTKLSRGEHEVKIVGAQDLKGNVMAPNPYQAKFTVSDEIKTPPTAMKPSIKEIKQVADNAVEVYFNAKDVVIADSAAADKNPVVIEKAAWDGTDWKDLKADLNAGSDIDITATTAAPKVVYGTYRDTDGVWKAKWTVLYEAGNDKSTTDAETFNYDSQNIVIRNVIVQNYEISGNTQAYYEGDTYRASSTFKKDVEAPLAQQIYADKENGKIYVVFKDDPFNGDIALGAAGKVKVKMTNSKAQDFYGEYDVTKGNISVVTSAAGLPTYVVPGKTVAIDVRKPDDNNQNLVEKFTATNNTTGTLIESAVYSVTFPQGTIVDAEENMGGSATPDYIMVDPSKAHKNAEKVMQVSVSKNSTDEGIVPQTTRGLIQSGYEIASGNIIATGSGTVVDKATAGTALYMAEKENTNKILVVFDGEVLETSAKNKNNYTFNGAVLPQTAQIEFYSNDINATVTNGAGGAESYVVITLPEGSVQKDGLYTIAIDGITNKSGKRMLPVRDSVALVDNTRPVLNNVKIIGDKQLEITFDEVVNIDSADLAKAVNNFAVTVNNGETRTVSTVTKVNNEPNKLILTLADTFDIAKIAKVTVKKDVNGNIYVTDTSDLKNVMAEVTVSSK
ncbi:hypothetical protein J2Z44_000956 [Clostridium punense]|uniref:SbsC C-terminal domain-containing protein n=1 Tax=Clostridium punense TaxID=1054297 RepID=A0ABS4K3D9_9CLOT|nr:MULTISPECIES: SwmB domain-containing protein [Clostridium]EQB88387.1 hypothetical protein M918_04395 [Clostridium sp. BL8]MBP2021169.1 hypothetical protein [Clostridium punense]